MEGEGDVLKPIKIRGLDTEIFGVSDTHFNHDLVWPKRGYASLADHDESLVAKWNLACSDNAQVVHCGDFVFKDPDGERCRELFLRLQFRTLFLLAGNHCSGVKQVYHEALNLFWPEVGAAGGEVYPLQYNVPHGKQVIFLPSYAEFLINGQYVVACHYPLLVHNEQKHGAQLWCGHSHQSLPLTNHETGQGKRLDLGVEAFGGPISFADIKAHLKDRELDIRDHHETTVT